MKKLVSILLSAAVILTLFTACGPAQSSEGAEGMYTGITLSDNGVLVGGTPASTDENNAVYVSDDIVFYLEGQGAEYGEGEKDEEHSQSEADKHTVINITKPGNYTITGKISNGQIAVNLGDNAKKDSDAVVNITLNNAEITCTVAPAIICYSAYECGSDDVKTATKDVNTENAGFNITLAEDSYNIIKGSHVAKIYKPGTEDKLHKYDAAIESLVSMNINSENGFLTVISDNEGIETKMHMTVNGGTLDIKSADDALNAGEDGVSVITVNNGTVWADSNKGVEGDGIDSNGWLVINGGTVYSFGNSDSMDSGLDSDMGIYINGGTVLATGNMYDEISKDSTQNFAVFNFAQPIYDKSVILKSLSDNSLTLLRGTA
ncbi:MAG: carbohydrate-binding domain-containing protein, partial [Oscillospiraceae bacterium]|nr:carbohydrate-binding domain-containing protein [Oscillospiraceae bacterium]